MSWESCAWAEITVHRLRKLNLVFLTPGRLTSTRGYRVVTSQFLVRLMKWASLFSIQKTSSTLARFLYLDPSFVTLQWSVRVLVRFRVVILNS